MGVSVVRNCGKPLAQMHILGLGRSEEADLQTPEAQQVSHLHECCIHVSVCEGGVPRSDDVM